MSLSSHWGKGQPVVTGIYPYSPAEQAGLKVHDIIEAIDGIHVTDVTVDEIQQLLNPAGRNDITLTVSNLNTPSKQLTFRKECKRSDAITEDQLASAFSLYSLESTSEQLFTCPFKTTTTTDPVDFSQFKTFAFAAIDENNRRLEEIINSCIEKELTKKGLILNMTEPDILIHTYYFFDKNPHYMGTNKILAEKQPAYRYDFTRSTIVKFPFLNYAAAEAEAEYLLQFGIRLTDRRDVEGRVLWECEANELLESSYRLDDYVRIHTPLMCMQYPYAKYSRNVQYLVCRKTYNYTGISYDINRLELISDVDRNSPAYAAGIRPRDVIEKIDHHEMNHSVEEFTAAYKQFISTTMKLRDANTLFTDANGFKYCMYWDKSSYPQVADAIRQTKYMSAFSYLYKYAPYVNPSEANTCTFHIKRGKNRMELVIRPSVRTEVTVEIK
jgi:hypothetical protein